MPSQEMLEKETHIHVFDDDSGLGILRFKTNKDLPTLSERATNELSDVFGIIACTMAQSNFLGTANITIENGQHAHKEFSLSIKKPTAKP